LKTFKHSKIFQNFYPQEWSFKIGLILKVQIMNKSCFIEKSIIKKNNSVFNGTNFAAFIIGNIF